MSNKKRDGQSKKSAFPAGREINFGVQPTEYVPPPEKPKPVKNSGIGDSKKKE